MDITVLFEVFTTILANQDILVKIALVLLLSVYLLFALVLTRQIFLLNDIINQITFAPIFKFLAILHLTLATILLASIVLVL